MQNGESMERRKNAFLCSVFLSHLFGNEMVSLLSLLGQKLDVNNKIRHLTNRNTFHFLREMLKCYLKVGHVIL